MPNVALPPRTPFTCQSTLVVDAPVTVDVNVFVFALPEVSVHGVDVHVGEIVTVGGATIVVADVTDNFGSSYDTAATLTIAGEGTWMGAIYLPEASILPTVSFPPGIPFTCQVTMLFVPPETPARNWVAVATVTETVGGAIAMLIPVVGSVHEEEAVVDVVEVVVVHVIAVLEVVAALWHEIRLKAPISKTKIGRRLTAPLSLILRMPIHSGSVAISLQKNANYISSCLSESVLPTGPATLHV
jgi:hypothetical protein